ncbi:hypothetical protein MVES_002522 [Malassezia vespertilionis]|uniref:Autophagy-related protein 27 n=2 Tax=Malassezia vespertilionis TaxID=2020962 RepID=A0A2N1JA91_9BASI|nr:hypothetical protein MVES_002522 [Malassezia vespertilionis]
MLWMRQLGALLAALVVVYAESCTFPGMKGKGLARNPKLDSVFRDGYIQTSSDLETPPSTTRRTVFVNLCGAITPKDGSDVAKECPSNAAVCIVTSTIRNNEPRVDYVIPAGVRNSYGKLVWTLQKHTLQLAGASWAQRQTFSQIKFECAKENVLKVRHYLDPLDTSSNTLSLALGAPELCRSSGSSGSLLHGLWACIKILFWLAILALLVYFVMGVWTNVSYYGATGWDLLPHRDFWRQLPGT